MNNLKLPASGIWTADVYLRLSKEDKAKKDESNSIKNQRALILDFVEKNPDISVSGILVDDGVTGAHFDRDDFRDMIEHIENGAVNCVIVKDFSRLGRDHIETGKYIERYFAAKNVRFIAINDNYDSLYTDMSDGANSLIVPFKNIMNEAFLEDISTKVRSQLMIKRKNGELVSCFVVYGYLKVGKTIIVDDYAADIVRKIFAYKINGYSESRIADILNKNGILSPAEHKKATGSNYKTPFSTSGKQAQWTPVAIKRVLSNRIYIGYLEQGKRSKVSYRVKKFTYKPREEWVVHKNNHEAIISEEDFNLVQDLLSKDTYVLQGTDTPLIFSGFVMCGHCGRQMTQQSIPRKNKTYRYYICTTHKRHKTCVRNCVKLDLIEEFALLSVQRQIAAILDDDAINGCYGADTLRERKKSAINDLIKKATQTIDDNNSYLTKSFKHFDAGIISEAEFKVFKANFNSEIGIAERNIALLRDDLKQLETDNRVSDLIERFKEFKNITVLDRRIVATLIHSIIIYGETDFEIRFRFENELDVESRHANAVCGSQAVQ